MSTVYWFCNFFIILEIKVALISYSLSKATSKAAENNELISLIGPTQPPAGSTLLAVPQPEWGMGKSDDGYHCKTAVTGGSWADRVFPYVHSRLST